MKCPICKTKNNSKIQKVSGYYSKSEFKIKSCLNCQIGFTLKSNILPVQNFYNKNYDYKAHEATKHEKLWRIKKTHSKILKKLSLSSNSQVLDIGCMYGFFLDFLKKKYGCKTLGLETENFYIKKNKNKIIIDDFFKFVKKIQFQKKFDLIIMSHSLEHFEHPLKVINSLKRLLKKDGNILIIVPNYYSYLSKFFKSYWGWLQPSAHYFHFSKKSLNKIFKVSNFKISLILENGGDSLFYLLTIFNISKIFVKSKKIYKPKNVQYLIIKLFSKVFKYLYYFGNDELVYLIKKR